MLVKKSNGPGLEYAQDHMLSFLMPQTDTKPLVSVGQVEYKIYLSFFSSYIFHFLKCNECVHV